jgi:hypothetical protein
MFLSVFGIDLSADVADVAAAAVRSGFAVVPVLPGGKVPLCTLPARAVKKADADGRHQCGVHHAITDAAEARRVFNRMQKGFTDPLNLGVVAYPSRVILVDADNPEPRAAFQKRMGYEISPTCETPGLFEDGRWKHKDGGHWYFAVPDGVELDPEPGMLTIDGYDVKWGWTQSLVPPSVRSEGPYLPVAEMLEAPDWIIEAINDKTLTYRERRKRSAEFVGNSDDPIAKWSQSVTWEDLLIEDGWSDPGKIDRSCGCPIFTRPGGGEKNWKSATAHEFECDYYENSEGHGPLHLWTTSVPDELEGLGSTLTKLQYVCAARFGGDMSAAMEMVEAHAWDGSGWITSRLFPNPGTPDVEPDAGDSGFESPDESPDAGDSPGLAGSDSANPESQPLEIVISGIQEETSPLNRFWLEHEDEKLRKAIALAAEKQAVQERARELVTFIQNHDNGTETMSVSLGIDLSTPPDPVVPRVGCREDGVPLLYRGRVNSIFGVSESAKSWFTLAMVMQVTEAGGRAAVIDMEDDGEGFRHRLVTVGCTQDQASRISYFRPWVLGQGDRAEILRHSKGCDLVVVDSLDAMTALMGSDSNNATAIRQVGAILKNIATVCDAAVLVVDHSTEKLPAGEKANTQLGSSAKKQLIDGSLFRADRLTLWRPNHECRTLIMAGKDRHGWAKANAIYPDDDASWGRVALLRMVPAWPDRDGAQLDVLKPPTYTEEPQHTRSEQAECEDAIVEYLRARPGTWVSQTLVFQAGGDKNGRGPQPAAVGALVGHGVISQREVPIRGGRVGIEYQYAPLDPSNPNPPNPRY